MKKTAMWATVIAGLAVAAHGNALSAEGNAEAGKTKFYTCLGCHGIAGITSTYPTYHVPKVGGQHPDYVVAALKAYQSGLRQHPSMVGAASPLTDEDMADIGAYLGRFRSINEDTPIKGNAQAGAAKSQACSACHAEDGNTLAGSYPRLAAQYEDYLIKVLQEYRTGTRKNAIMNGATAQLTDADITNLAAYYASQRKGLTVLKDE